mmetsp:Transcript_28198/g.55216  ORF Transcript_28198/g.55216 Transcript_28198/m.55216 type:complete len:85 (+) Transcript_28198:168-422(+)
MFRSHGVKPGTGDGRRGVSRTIEGHVHIRTYKNEGDEEHPISKKSAKRKSGGTESEVEKDRKEIKPEREEHIQEGRGKRGGRKN